MTQRNRGAGLWFGASLLLAASATLAQAPVPAEETPEMFPAGPHRDDAFYACVACHNFKLVAAQGLSREKWAETLDWMVTKHNMPPLAADERTRVLAYLAEVFPPRAPAQQGGWKNPFLN